MVVLFFPVCQAVTGFLLVMSDALSETDLVVCFIKKEASDHGKMLSQPFPA
jgi:hypothetical protein